MLLSYFIIMSDKLPLLLIDVTFLRDQYYRRGIGRYGKEIVSRLVRDDIKTKSFDLHLLGFGSLEENMQLLEVQDLRDPGITWHSLGDPKLSSPLSNLYLYYFKVRPLVKTLAPDLYFAAHYDRGLPSGLVQVVVFVADYTMFVLNAFSTKGKIFNFLKGVFYKFMFREVRNAKTIITCSNFSKKDLIEKAGLDRDKTFVTYLGVSDIFSSPNMYTPVLSSTLSKFGLKDVNYLIYDGGFEQNKNAGQLLEVFKLVKEQTPGLKLVVTDKEFVYKDGVNISQSTRADIFQRKAEELGVWLDVIATGRITDEELAALTSNALVYVNLSLYEGFGFGPLQAMQVGVPAVISDRTSFPEIAGDGAILVGLGDNMTIAEEVIRLIKDEDHRRKVIEKGSAKVRNFSWQLCYTQTKEIFSNLIERKI